MRIIGSNPSFFGGIKRQVVQNTSVGFTASDTWLKFSGSKGDDYKRVEVEAMVAENILDEVTESLDRATNWQKRNILNSDEYMDYGYDISCELDGKTYIMRDILKDKGEKDDLLNGLERGTFLIVVENGKDTSYKMAINRPGYSAPDSIMETYFDQHSVFSKYYSKMCKQADPILAAPGVANILNNIDTLEAGYLSLSESWGTVHFMTGGRHYVLEWTKDKPAKLYESPFYTAEDLAQEFALYKEKLAEINRERLEHFKDSEQAFRVKDYEGFLKELYGDSKKKLKYNISPEQLEQIKQPVLDKVNEVMTEKFKLGAGQDPMPLFIDIARKLIEKPTHQVVRYREHDKRDEIVLDTTKQGDSGYYLEITRFPEGKREYSDEITPLSYHLRTRDTDPSLSITILDSEYISFLDKIMAIIKLEDHYSYYREGLESKDPADFERAKELRVELEQIVDNYAN